MLPRPDRSSHASAFFSLIPLNARSKAVVNDPDNAHLVSCGEFGLDNGVLKRGLDIGPFINNSPFVLATIGRDGDIKIPNESISRIHCSFELHPGNREEILLYDRSSSGSTRVFGESVMQFELQLGPRRVVVDSDTNLEFGFGGAADNLYHFRLFWHHRDRRHKTLSRLHAIPHLDRPCKAPTLIDPPLTLDETLRRTRIHAPGASKRFRYLERRSLGKGGFGEVFKVVNVNTGEYVAVKRLSSAATHRVDRELIKREIETLSGVSHVSGKVLCTANGAIKADRLKANIVRFLGHQQREIDGCDEIIMELKSGSAHDLMKQKVFIQEPSIAEHLLRHMLQALVYLDSKNIIHRDVKPGNILFSPLPGPQGPYQFQLADFGLANVQHKAHTFAGTEMFMAPELAACSKGMQTTKIDVWSLFVTYADVLDVEQIQDKLHGTGEEQEDVIEQAALTALDGRLQKMALPDPVYRTSARAMLDSLGDGKARLRRW